ncbi:MAG: glycosyl hydrolase family 28-related protein [Candidatus Gastranaerophilales bacterium]|nr:glycosyl hydrolase family 28-related protein [Candidatus Gastranaerophilales bacterium]
MSQVNLPHRFSSGAKALASEVNDNFDALKNSHNDLDDIVSGYTADVDYLKDLSVNIKKYGAVMDGITDDTDAVKTAINAARSAGTGIFIPGETFVTDTLVLASDTLTFVPIYGSGASNSFIKANMDKPVINCAGITTKFSSCALISDICIQNLSTGSNAACIKADYSNFLSLRDTELKARGVGIIGTNCCYGILNNVFITGTDDKGQVGLSGKFINFKFFGGKISLFSYGFDVQGDSLSFSGLNIASCRVAFKHAGISGAIFTGCHFESCDMLLTNAETVPIEESGTTWTDNSSSGIGLSGEMAFVGCIIRTSGSDTNFIVLKTQSSFVYRLRLQGCKLDSGSNYIISSSFAYNDIQNIPSGTTLELINNCDQPVYSYVGDSYTKVFHTITNSYVFSSISNRSVLISENDEQAGIIISKDGSKSHLKFNPAEDIPDYWHQADGCFCYHTTRGLISYSSDGWFTVPSKRMSSIPTSGTWIKGDIILNSTPAASGSIGWVCTQTGTLGTLSSVTGSITSGTDLLTVNSVSNLHIGDYITVAGVTGNKLITAINSDTKVVTLSSNANATVNNAAVNYYSAIFKTWGAISA